MAARSRLVPLLLCLVLAAARSSAAEDAPPPLARPSTPPVALGVNSSAAELNPVLQRNVAALRRRVVDGTPFRLSERLGRLDRLDALLQNPASDPVERVRRTFEAHRIELDYGRNIEAYRERLETDGSSRLVDFLRVGRLALYYQTLDGRESGVWSADVRRWERLSGEDSEKIAKALRSARKLEAPQLLTLPLPTAAPAPPSVPDLTTNAPNPVSAAGSREVPSDARKVTHDITLAAQIREEVHALEVALSQTYTPHAPKLRRLLDLVDDPDRLPTAGDINALFAALHRELEDLGHVSRFRTTVYAPDGRAAEREVLRVGTFGLIADGHYLVYAPEVQHLLELPRQPADQALALAEDFTEAPPQTLAPVAIDPSGGQTLQLLVQAPRLGERIRQGGPVGYLIIALGTGALLLALYRYAALTRTERRIRAQLQLTENRLDNPLGRILAHLATMASDQAETLELAVDEALLVEQSRLEQSLPLLKLLASIAPMLGLLGTVTGMIATFQVIALHGSGDAKLMSGGISEALVTTVLGLIAAIPILLLHSTLTAKCMAITTLLEAHSGAAVLQRLRRAAGPADTLNGNTAVPRRARPETSARGR